MNMKTYFLSMIICLFFFISCGMEETQDKKSINAGNENSGTEKVTQQEDKITVCGVIEPEKNIPWLAELIAKAETDKTGTYLGVIWLERYKDQDVFVTDMMLESGGLAYHVFDCEGNAATIDKADAQDFFNNLKKDIVIYAHPDHPLSLQL
jgi:hypothetical protein